VGGTDAVASFVFANERRSPSTTAGFAKIAARCSASRPRRRRDPYHKKARHLGKFLRQAPCLISCEKRGCSVAPPIEVGQGSTACVLDDEFAGGFNYSPGSWKTRQHTRRVHFCLPSINSVNRDMGFEHVFAVSALLRIARLCGSQRGILTPPDEQSGGRCTSVGSWRGSPNGLRKKVLSECRYATLI
jgi:hypothetical protein